MSPVSANFQKYRGWSFFFAVAWILIVPGILLMMWSFRDLPVAPGSLAVYLLPPLALGAIVGTVELGTLQSPMAWGLPGHLESVRTLLVRVGLVSSIPVLLCLSQREESLSAFQLASVGAASLFCYCLGLAPRIFPSSGMNFWSMIPLVFIAAHFLPKTVISGVLQLLILKSPILMITLSSIAGVFCWRRLGDRNRIHAFLQKPNLSVLDPRDRENFRAYLQKVRPEKESGRTRLVAQRILLWLIEKIRDRSMPDWRRRLFGALVNSCETAGLRMILVGAMFPLFLVFPNLILGTLDGERALGLSLHAIIGTPILALLLISVGVAFDLWLQPQASLLLPTGRRNLLRARWAILIVLFGLFMIAIMSQFAVSLSLRTFLPAAAWNGGVDEMRLSVWLRLSYLAVLIPGLVACGFALQVDRPGEPIFGLRLVMITVVASVGILVFVAILYALPPVWRRVCLWLGVAGLWSFAIPLLRRSTLNQDTQIARRFKRAG